MSETKIQIEAKRCDICGRNNHKHSIVFASIHRNLRELGLDFCTTCNDLYQVVDVNDLDVDKYERDTNSTVYLIHNLYAVKTYKKGKKINGSKKN